METISYRVWPKFPTQIHVTLQKLIPASPSTLLSPRHDPSTRTHTNGSLQPELCPSLTIPWAFLFLDLRTDCSLRFAACVSCSLNAGVSGGRGPILFSFQLPRAGLDVLTWEPGLGHLGAIGQGSTSVHSEPVLTLKKLPARTHVITHLSKYNKREP